MERIFCKVLSLDLSAIVAVGLVLIARLFLRKAPKRCSYILWSAVLLRLVIPFSLTIPGKNLLPVSSDAITPGAAAGSSPVISTGNQFVDAAVTGILPKPGIGAGVDPARILFSVGTAVWLLGIAILALLSFSKLAKLNLLIGSDRSEKIIVSEKLGTAFVLGIFHPVICLPAGLSESEKEMIIAHESTHIRRGDHIVKLVAYIVLVIHWFDPVMWLAFRLATRDMEMSCDEAVIRNSGCKRSEYASALLRLSVGKEILPAIPPTFGEGAVKERIVNVMKFRINNAFVSIIAVIAAALIVTACAVTGSKPSKTTVNFAATDFMPGFSVQMQLPEGWKVGGEAASYYDLGYSGDLLLITDKDGNEVGSVGANFYPDYSEYDDPQYPEPFSENYWQLVYPELRLPAHRNWDINPATRIRTDDGETMLADIYTQIPDENTPAASWDSIETKGIVSYNESKHVYTCVEFYTNEFDISDETIQEIAKSLEFVSEK